MNMFEVYTRCSDKMTFKTVSFKYWKRFISLFMLNDSTMQKNRVILLHDVLSIFNLTDLKNRTKQSKSSQIKAAHEESESIETNNFESQRWHSMMLLWYLLFTITPDFLNFTIHEKMSPTSTWTLHSSLESVSPKSVNFRRCLSNVLSCKPDCKQLSRS